MATIIDALVVTLGLDGRAFKKGVADAGEDQKKLSAGAGKAGRDIEAGAKRAAEAIGQIRTQVIGLMAAFTAGKGLREFITSTIETDAAAGRLASQVGLTAEQLTAWQGVAERAGGSAQGMGATIEGLAQQFQQFTLTGQSGVVPYFNAVGVAMADASGKMRPMGDILLDLADKFQGMDPARAQAIGRGMGIDPATIILLEKGRGAVAGMLAEQERIGHANAADAASAQALQASLRELGQAATDMGRKLLTSASPAIQAAIQALSGFVEWAKTHQPMVRAAFAGLAAAAVAFGVALAAPMAPIIAMTAAIGALVAGLALLYDDWQTWTEGGASRFGKFWQAVAAGWRRIQGLIQPVIRAWESLFRDGLATLADSWNALVALFTGSPDEIRAAWSRLFGDLASMSDDWTAALEATVSAAVDGIKTLFSGLFSRLGDGWQDIGTRVSAALDSWKTLFLGLTETFRDAWHAVITLFTGSPEEIRAAWSKLWGDLGGDVDKLIDLIKKAGPLITDAIKAAFSAAFDWVAERANAIWAAITGKRDSPKPEAKASPVPAAPAPAQTQGSSAPPHPNQESAPRHAETTPTDAAATSRNPVAGSSRPEAAAPATASSVAPTIPVAAALPPAANDDTPLAGVTSLLRAIRDSVTRIEEHFERLGRSGAPNPGPAGAPGQPGVPGLPGSPGVPGDSGAAGVPGNPGAAGSSGIPGIPGAPGVAGSPGLPGAAGEAGRGGDAGAPGIPGNPGLPGVAGAPGIPGAPGKGGMPGTPGVPGRPGAAGVPGLPGAAGAPAPMPSPSPHDPRGIRNNNPGNLNYAGQAGATKEVGPNGRFAVFQSMEEGIAALARQLQRYAAGSLDTVKGIISKYAPGNENNTSGYIASVVKALGLQSADQKLDLSSSPTLKALISAISTMENGKGRVTGDQIDRGLSMGAQASVVTSHSNDNRQYNNDNRAASTSTTEVHVGQVTVQTQATDARGVAQGLGSAIENYAFASQANQGLV